MKHQIFPCLWFDSDAQAAAAFYCSILPDSKILDQNHFLANFSTGGQKFMCLNGNKNSTFNASISFFINSGSKAQLKAIWDGMLEGGQVRMPLQDYPWSSFYGWIQDRFGVNWQLMLDQNEDNPQLFRPTLMFSDSNFGNAERAINFYSSIFSDSELKFVSRYGAEHGDQAGKINHAQFQLNGQLFAAMDSGIMHGVNFNESISFVITCDTQEEIDFYWSKLTEGGSESQCGWLKDQFGISWQVVPAILSTLMADPQKSQKVMEAFLKMKKFDIGILENC